MSQRPRRVLVVDDDNEMRAAICPLLEGAGFEVEEASNGREALAALQSSRPDVIVLDLMMPEMDGWEFRALQKRDAKFASTPIVVVTADGSPGAKSVDAGAYLTKPFRFQNLVEAIGAVLSDRDRPQVVERMAHSDRLASLGTLAAGVAHEINNPLTVVTESLRGIERDLREPGYDASRERVSRRLSQAIECAERIRRIVSDISVFARSDAPLGPVDVQAALRTATEIALPEIHRNGAELETQLFPVPLVTANDAQLIQVFVNLLVNAAQAVRSDRPGRIVLTTATAANGAAWIDIADNGQGMSEEVRARIFDPFYTTKPVGAGTGLGLSICHGIVTALGGSIQVHSTGDDGTRFRVQLPAQG